MRVRQIFTVTLVFLLILGSGAVGGSATGTYKGFETVKVIVNGREVAGDVPGIIMDGRTLVPLRLISEALGLEVDYDASQGAALVTGQAQQNSVEPPKPEPTRKISAKGIIYMITQPQLEDAVAFGKSNRDKEYLDEFLPEYVKSISGSLYGSKYFNDHAVLITEWSKVAVWAHSAARENQPFGAEDAANINKPGIVDFWVDLWGNDEYYGQNFTAFLKQGNKIVELEAHGKIFSQTYNFGQGTRPSHLNRYLYSWDPKGMDLSFPITLMILKPNGEMFSFEWDLQDLR